MEHEHSFNVIGYSDKIKIMDEQQLKKYQTSKARDIADNSRKDSKVKLELEEHKYMSGVNIRPNFSDFFS